MNDADVIRKVLERDSWPDEDFRGEPGRRSALAALDRLESDLRLYKEQALRATEDAIRKDRGE